LEKESFSIKFDILYPPPQNLSEFIEQCKKQDGTYATHPLTHNGQNVGTIHHCVLPKQKRALSLIELQKPKPLNFSIIAEVKE